MRRVRRLLLLFALLILAGVGITYHVQRGRQERSAPAPPKALPGHVSAAADHWCWSHTEGNRSIVEVCAANFRQITEPSKFELSDVELRIFQKDGKTFDKVRSAKADFDIDQKVLRSEGDVEITLAVPADGAPAGRLLMIRSSGVTFESTTGKARTDRPASFTFDTAEGSAVGAAYDPGTRELELFNDVDLTWRGRGPKAKPMRIAAGHLIYKERDSQVFLSPWSKLRRDTLALDAADAVVTLEKGAIRLVEAQKAKGNDSQEKRKLDYQAERLSMRFNADTEVEHLTGEGDARLTAVSDTGRTHVTSGRVDLQFDTDGEESILKKVDATSNAVVESVPLVKAGMPVPATRLLKSETIVLLMRGGGREIDRLEMHAPGTIDFLPNRPGEPRRHLSAFRMGIQYGANNQIESFRAVQVATRTERQTPRKTVSTALTWSQDLSAEFEPKTGQMKRMEQWPDFRYEEGDRRARSEKATMEAGGDLITLNGRARVSDSNGSTDADVIVLDQKSGGFTAEGHVTSVRQPDRKGAGSAMLASDQSMQARAQKMTAANNNRQVVYDGGAAVWQGANRLEADHIAIDREKRQLAARGKVVSQFLDSAKSARSAFVVIRAPEMIYTDEDRLAFYKGGVDLTRPGMTIRGREIKAYLREAKSESSLDRAEADGQVIIVQTAKDRTRTGTGEHADYYEQEQRVILTGGEPQLVDSVRGTTRGRRLTYYANRDHLIVEGGGTRPTVSRLKR